MLHQVIDRRLSGKNKSIGNRERFLRRYREQIRDAVRKAVGDGNAAYPKGPLQTSLADGGTGLPND